ncbi:MAG: hypothetical protein K2J89_05660 [Clostridia bacterium]|nr:hypothetical protein [Clostridia bacterium]
MEQERDKKEMRIKYRRIKNIITCLIILVIIGSVAGVFGYICFSDQIRSRNLLTSFEKTGFNYSMVNIGNQKEIKVDGKTYWNEVQYKLIATIYATKVVEDIEDIKLYVSNYGKFEYSSDDDKKEYCYGEYFQIDKGCDEAFMALAKYVNESYTTYEYKYALIQKGKIIFLVNYSVECKDDELPESLEKLLKSVKGKQSIVIKE